MRAINVEVSEVLKKLYFSAQIDFLQLFGEIYDIGTKVIFVQCFVTTGMFFVL